MNELQTTYLTEINCAAMIVREFCKKPFQFIFVLPRYVPSKQFIVLGRGGERNVKS